MTDPTTWPGPQSPVPPAALQAGFQRPLQTPTVGHGADPAAIDKAAREFEAVFISQMLSHMWSGVEVDETFGGGHAEEVFRGLMIEEQGKVIARSGGFGIADHVRRALLDIQEAQGGAIQGDLP